MTTRTHLHAPLQYTDAKAQRLGQIRAAQALQPDTIDWTEVQKPDQVEAINHLAGYVTYWGLGRLDVHPMNYAPISWRGVRFKMLEAQVLPASKGVGGEFPAKWFARVVLEDRETGERVARVSAHMVPGIQSLGDETPNVREATIAAHAENVRVFRGLMNHQGLPTVGGTDANDTRFPAKLGTGFTIAATGATHGSRRIDFVVGRNVTGLTGRTVPLGSSDHRGILATVTTAAQAPPKETPVDRIVTRAEWGARPRGASRSSHPIGATKGITAHWEGPHMGDFPHSSCAGKVRGIEAFHRDGRHWADIAYNALVCPHGYVFEGRGPGVKSAANGNATDNDDWYAVCYLGGERDPFTAAGKAGFLLAFDWLTREGNAGPARNGHRDHKATACPGDVIHSWIHSLSTTKPVPPPTTPEEFRMDTEAREAFAALNKKIDELGREHDAIFAGSPLVRQIARAVANEVPADVDEEALAAALIRQLTKES